MYNTFNMTGGYLAVKKRAKGFTIVELLIVIIVIAILASIVTVAYVGAQQRAYNSARLSEVKAWQKLLMMYYTEHTQGPSVAAGSYCLGTGFPNGACRDYLGNGSTTYYQANNSTLMSQLNQEGSLPGGPRVPVNGTIGPYVNIWAGGSGFTITTVFNGKASECPAPLTYTWDDGAGRLLCQVDVQYY